LAHVQHFAAIYLKDLWNPHPCLSIQYQFLASEQKVVESRTTVNVDIFSSRSSRCAILQFKTGQR